MRRLFVWIPWYLMCQHWSAICLFPRIRNNVSRCNVNLTWINFSVFTETVSSIKVKVCLWLFNYMLDVYIKHNKGPSITRWHSDSFLLSGTNKIALVNEKLSIDNIAFQHHSTLLGKFIFSFLKYLLQCLMSLKRGGAVIFLLACSS